MSNLPTRAGRDLLKNIRSRTSGHRPGGTLIQAPAMAPKPAASSPTTPPVLDEAGRALAKRWLDNWKRVGPILEQERWDCVKALTDADAARDAIRLFDLWQPDWPTDEGEELLLHRRVFDKARRRG